MTTGWDAIVIGAGHNGLAAAHVLAKAGQRVLVIERSAQVGGMTSDIELAPGHHCPRFAHLLHGPLPNLPSGPPLPTVSLSPDGRHVVIDGDRVHYADGASHPDEASYIALRRRLMQFGSALAPLMTTLPPMPGTGGWRQADQLGRLFLRLRRLGKPMLREFLRIALSNVHDLISDEMADGPLAGAMAMDAILGARAGPRSPGTVIGLLYRSAQGGEHRWPAGGMGAVAKAMAAAATGAGASIRLNSKASGILVSGDRAVGVRVGEEELPARRVLSSLDVRTTMLLAGVVHFDAEMVRRVRHVRADGVTGKLNLALDRRPAFTGLNHALHRSRIVVAPSLAHVERAFNALKHGEVAARPVMEAVLSGENGPPPTGGRPVLSAIVQYVPWTTTSTDAAGAALSVLGEHAPGLRSSIIAQEFLAPADIARETGSSGGHWHHAEMALDQLLMNRPVTGMGDYQTGLPGLLLCGAGSHPGGDVTTAPGRNAARAALRMGMP